MTTAETKFILGQEIYYTDNNESDNIMIQKSVIVEIRFILKTDGVLIINFKLDNDLYRIHSSENVFMTAAELIETHTTRLREKLEKQL